MTDPVTLGYIGLASSIVTGILMVVNTLIQNSHTRELAKLGVAVATTKDSIVTLEKNTNSIKDELVRVTGQKNFAEGVKLGTEQALAAALTHPSQDPENPIWKR